MSDSLSSVMAELQQESEAKAIRKMVEVARKAQATKADLRAVIDAANAWKKPPEVFNVFVAAVRAHAEAKITAATFDAAMAARDAAMAAVVQARAALETETARLEVELQSAEARLHAASRLVAEASDARATIAQLEVMFKPLFDASAGPDDFALPADISAGRPLPPPVLQALRSAGLVEGVQPTLFVAPPRPREPEVDLQEIERRRQELREQHARLMFHLEDRAAPQATSAFTRETL